MKNLKQFILALLLCCTSGMAWAYDFEVDGIYYNITSDEEPYTVSLTISGSIYAPYSGDLSIPTSVTYNGQTYLVSEIGEEAFKNCSGLTSVTIPNTVTSICDYAFYSCTGLSSIAIPNSVEKIGYYAFYGCTGFTSVTIPESVTSISDDAFQGCGGLTSVNFNATNCSLNGYAGFFSQSITSLTIGNNVQKIPDLAFYGCSGLTSVIIPNSVISIGRSAFWGCSGITSITIPNSVETIGSGTFSNTGLTSITIPESVISIGEYAFQGCVGLTSVIIPNSVKKVGRYAFRGCTGLTSVTIGNSVETIGEEAFSGCTGLVTVNFNATNCVYESSYSPFYGCSNLSTLNIGENVQTIPSNAFDGCTELESFTIPNSVTKIYRSSFSNTARYNNLYNQTNGNNVYMDGWCLYIQTYSNSTPTVADGTKGIAIGAIKYDDQNVNKTFKIPQSVIYIPGNPLYIEAFPIAGFEVASNNTRFKSVDGVLYNYDKTILIACSPRKGSLAIPNTVIEILPGAFSCLGGYANPSWGNHGPSSITIPNSVKKIGNSAFSYCTNLQNISIPNSVETIGKYAFNGCTGLTSITIGKNLRDIGEYAFYQTNIEDVNIHSIATWCELSGEYHIQNNNANLYLNGNLITNLVIPNSVTSIRSRAFSGFTGLTSVTIPNSVTTIGDCAFYSCAGLTSVTIPNSVTKIESNAFSNCTGLTSVTIPNSVTEIGSSFCGCTSLVTVNFNAINCVNESDGGIFVSCPNLSSLNIDENVQKIPDHAFRDCSGLTSVSIPGSVTSIGISAFAATGLTSVTIPDSVKTIGYNAFGGYGGNDLNYVVSLKETPPDLLGGSSFANYNTIVLHVKCDAKEKYESSKWNFNFSSIEEDFCPSHSIELAEENQAGGTVSLSASEATKGDEVLINITVEDGYAIKTITVYNAEDPTQTVSVYSKNTSKSAYTYAFIMPNFEVKVAVDIQKSGLGIGEDNILTTLHPNPTSGIVTIEAENLRYVSVFNTIGQKVYETTASGNDMECNLSSCGTGVYLMQIETDKGITTRRVVVR